MRSSFGAVSPSALRACWSQHDRSMSVARWDEKAFDAFGCFCRVLSRMTFSHVRKILDDCSKKRLGGFLAPPRSVVARGVPCETSSCLSPLCPVMTSLPCNTARVGSDRAGRRRCYSYSCFSKARSGRVDPDPGDFELLRGTIDVDISKDSGTRAPRSESSRSEPTRGDHEPKGVCCCYLCCCCCFSPNGSRWLISRIRGCQWNEPLDHTGPRAKRFPLGRCASSQNVEGLGDGRQPERRSIRKPRIRISEGLTRADF